MGPSAGGSLTTLSFRPCLPHIHQPLLSAISIQGGHSHFLDGATATANDANSSADADADWADASTSTLQRAANLLDLLFLLGPGCASGAIYEM